MINRFFVGLLILFVMKSVFAEELIAQKAEKFDFYTPKGFSINKSSPTEDFDIYSIESKGKQFLSIYLGNHPSFPKSTANVGAMTMFDAGSVKIASQWINGRLAKREVLIKISERGWPNYLHAWTSSGLDDSEIEVADAVLMSLNTQGNLGKPR
jgi:hypothetical protein